MVHPGPIDTPLFASGLERHRPHPADPARCLPAGGDRPARWWPPPPTRAGRRCSAGETRLLDLTFAAARPVAETVLMLVDRWTRSGPEPAPQPGSLWEPPRGSRRAAAATSRRATACSARCSSVGACSRRRRRRCAWRGHVARFGAQVLRNPGAILRPSPEARSAAPCAARSSGRGGAELASARRRASRRRRRASARSPSAGPAAVGVRAEDPVAEVGADAHPVALVLEVVQAVVAPDRPVPPGLRHVRGVDQEVRPLVAEQPEVGCSR